MEKLYTAVGRFQYKEHTVGGKDYPKVILKNKELILDIQEMIVWSVLNWRILPVEHIKALYNHKIIELDFYSQRSFEECLCRLIQRGLVAEGIGDQPIDALYDLLSDLYIIPISDNLLLKFISFIRLTVFYNRPYPVTKKLLKRDKRSADERKVIMLAKQATLSTAEIINCISKDKLILKNDKDILDTLYYDKYTTSDNISAATRYLRECHPVLTSVANLYLRKQLIFERV